MKKTFLTSLLALALPLFMSAQAPYVSQVWNPDLGNGMYKNPVINADYSDPDVIAVGDDYYLTASSFEHMPGLPILHSTDLVNWEIIGHAVTKPYNSKSGRRLGHGNGVWAPCLRHHNGEFYIYWGDPDTGVWMVKTKNPRGKWDDPVCVIPGKGMIDTTPLWDEDGRCYLANGWANSRAGFASVISVRELNAEGTAAIGDPVIVFDGNGTEYRTAEGPKFYKREGWYWLMFPAGGVPTGFQVAARAKSPYGPYEYKIVMAQGKTGINGPHQGGWVHTSQGEDWFMHFQDKGAYGRVVHLQPVTWKDNWPVMGRVPAKGYCGEPYTTFRKPKTATPSVNVNPQESDEFDAPKLGLQWQWEGRYDQTFGQMMTKGVFRLYNYRMSAAQSKRQMRETTAQMSAADCMLLAERNALGNLWDIPSILAQKTPADDFTATTKVTLTSKADNEYAGLVMMGLSYSGVVAKRVGNEFVVMRTTNAQADKKGIAEWTEVARLKPTRTDKIDYQPGIHLDVYFRVVVSGGKATFYYSTNGKLFKLAGDVFTMREGKWVGAKVGLISATPNDKGSKGWMDIDWFRVTK